MLGRAPLCLLVASALLSACGTTVQGVGQAAPGSGIDGLGGTATAAAQDAGAGLASGASPGEAPGSGTAAREPGVAAPTTPAGSVGEQQGPIAVRPLPQASTIKVGVPYIDAQEGSAFTNSVGSGLATGDTKASMTLRINDLNKRGGILGRKVVPYFHKIDINSQPAQYQQAACSAFTQDNKVQYVTDNLGPLFLSCMKKAGIGVLATGRALMTSKGFATYSTFVMPDAIALDRLARLQASRFLEMGYFGNLKTTKVGIIYYDEPEFVAAEKVLEAALKSRGITVATSQALHYVASTADVGQTVSEAGSAVLKFRSSGVTHVLAVEENAWLTGGFGIAAASQKYYPRYGYTSNEPLGNIASNVPAEALKGALFLGWIPAYDVNDPKQLTAKGRACLAFFAKTQLQDTPNQRGTLITACETLDFLREALTAAGSSNGAQSLVAGGAKLTGFASSETYGVRVTADRRDGVSAVRPGEWNDGCSCFRYTGPPAAI